MNVQNNKQIRLVVNGMTCDDCERHVFRALQGIGVEKISADYRQNEARFELKDLNLLDDAAEAIERAGYRAGEATVLRNRPENPTIVEDNAEYDYDFLIIGSGGSAFAAAIEAANHGASVAMVERGTIGGTCVNVGCVPSKTMLRAGELNYQAGNNPFHGLNTDSGPVNLEALIEMKNDLVGELRQTKYEDLIDEYGFELIQGEARFVDEVTVEVNGKQITARRFLIATGASPYVPDVPGLESVDYLVSTTALELKELPQRLAVIGSGYVALELGQMFHNLGVDVTLMQRSQRVLKSYEPEISETVLEALTKQGIRFVTGAEFERVDQAGNTKRVHVTAGGRQQVIEADAVLVAAGRLPNTKSLNLEAANVKMGEKEEVVVDDSLRTTNPRIFAAGDVTMGPQFVYVAAYEGGLAAKNALTRNENQADLSAVPGVVFTSPAVATVGVTEQEAIESGYEVKTSLLPLSAVPRAQVNHEAGGLFKVVADARTERIIGVHVAAENAGDVIYAGVLAVKFGLTIDDIKSTFAPYLTMAEGLKLAALTFDTDVSKLSCCAG